MSSMSVCGAPPLGRGQHPSQRYKPGLGRNLERPEYDPAHDTRVRWFGSVKPGTASRTAQRVAACRLTFERVPFSSGDPDAEERLARDLAGPVGSQSNEAMVRYLAARTSFFDRVVVDALNREITQVVLAGAGYDGRALRYDKPGVTWYEVDHPDTQNDKRMRLHRLGIETPNVVFVPADFGDEGLRLHHPRARIRLQQALVASLRRCGRLSRPAGARVLAARASPHRLLGEPPSNQLLSSERRFGQPNAIPTRYRRHGRTGPQRRDCRRRRGAARRDEMDRHHFVRTG